MLGYLDIVSSTSHLMLKGDIVSSTSHLLKGVNTSVVILFDFNSLPKHYYDHCYNNRNLMNINQSFYGCKYHEDAYI